MLIINFTFYFFEHQSIGMFSIFQYIISNPKNDKLGSDRYKTQNRVNPFSDYYQIILLINEFIISLIIQYNYY